MRKEPEGLAELVDQPAGVDEAFTCPLDAIIGFPMPGGESSPRRVGAVLYGVATEHDDIGLDFRLV